MGLILQTGLTVTLPFGVPLMSPARLGVLQGLAGPLMGLVFAKLGLACKRTLRVELMGCFAAAAHALFKDSRNPVGLAVILPCRPHPNLIPRGGLFRPAVRLAASRYPWHSLEVPPVLGPPEGVGLCG